MKKTLSIVALVIILGAAGIFVARHSASESVANPSDATLTLGSPDVSASSTQAVVPAAVSQPAKSDWKVYTDPIYHFTVSYPPVWRVSTTTVPTPNGPVQIISIGSDIRAKDGRSQVNVTLQASKLWNMGLSDTVEYSPERGGLVDVTTDPVTCVPASHLIGAQGQLRDTDVYRFDEAHVGQSVMTNDAILSDAQSMLQIRDVEITSGNADVSRILSSIGFADGVRAISARCTPSPVTAADMAAGATHRGTDQNLIVQVTSPAYGETWEAGMLHAIRWNTTATGATSSVSFELVDRVSRRSCLLGSAPVRAMSMVVTITVGQKCVSLRQTNGNDDVILEPGDYALYLRYPYVAQDPYNASITGSYYSDPLNTAIRLKVLPIR